MDINPKSHVLGPLEHVEIKITVVGSISPSIYEGELETKIYWIDLDKKKLTSPGSFAHMIDEKKGGHGKQSSKHENSNIPTPKSSAVERGKPQDKFKDFKSETLFLRIKKKSKINVSY
jgi:hypothetical protein